MGHSAVCIASGPSLTQDDCEAVRVWRDSGSSRFVVVVNNTHALCPWADALYAMDNEWWRQYGAYSFQGERYSRFGNYGTYPVKDHGHNSGAGAILLAAELGATHIVLLGYDCQMSEGKAHWHENHKRPLKNAGSIQHWPKQFEEAKNKLDGVHVANASRETALTCFPRVRLEDELHTFE